MFVDTMKKSDYLSTCLEALWHPVKARLRKALLRDPLRNLTQAEFDDMLVRITREVCQSFAMSCLRSNYDFIW